MRLDVLFNFQGMAPELHGGTITVASAVGQGSAFTIEIPPGAEEQ